MDSYEVLERVEQILRRPDNWTRGQVARPHERGGFGFCLMGAISVAAFGRPGLIRDFGDPIRVAVDSPNAVAAVGATLELRQIARERACSTVECLNDRAVSHGAIYEVVQLAVRRAKAKQATPLAGPERAGEPIALPV